MKIVACYRDTEKTWETGEPDVVFGRTGEKSEAVLDLFPDKKVSREHGRIWEEGGFHWIEDLNSKGGTLLNGREIKGQGKHQLRIGDRIVAGNTTLRVELPRLPDAPSQTRYLEHGSILLPDTPEADVATAGDLSAILLNAVPVEVVGEEAARRLKVICDVPLQLAGKTNREALLRVIVDRLVELIPNATSVGLVLRDSNTDALLLKAYHSDTFCSVSETLARRAVENRKAFIWKRSATGDLSGTLLAGPIAVGMYAPLLWQEEALGVICADSHKLDAVFTEDDLRLMVMMAQYAAMTVANHDLQETLRRESAVKANLLRQFSPALAERLLAHRGQLQLGGERREVTLLCSDIRGFTIMSSQMQPDEILGTLNEYFGYLVPVIFANHGMIDKFMGDAILAVFGSPEPDPAHHEHAVRAALEMQAVLAWLNAARSDRGARICQVGIGVHCGEVVQGFVGTADRMEFTVIGDVVNRTSRYTAGASGEQILISPELHERVWRLVEAEKTTIATKHEGDLAAYRVLGLKAGRRDPSGASPAAGR
ncbi:MAG: adenylate/guanylate cyclase domain-containing protein [Terriglobales bacterium]|jgi:adenylate cyclase